MEIFPGFGGRPKPEFLFALTGATEDIGDPPDLVAVISSNFSAASRISLSDREWRCNCAATAENGFNISASAEFGGEATSEVYLLIGIARWRVLACIPISCTIVSGITATAAMSDPFG